jgi:hypothetical protein
LVVKNLDLDQDPVPDPDTDLVNLNPKSTMNLTNFQEKKIKNYEIGTYITTM